ncbi:hypothetical protein EKG35_08905 [Lysinibacillus telephonicus]|uniref:Uncharacterized protein n=1 Tax=Lysinibacillus telephonicus TaxID=1714840 RepID=A0A431USA2_9BACI|nr:hypothetical protein EKG35_08905 [Lysinibacillus telephonicus]
MLDIESIKSTENDLSSWSFFFLRLSGSLYYYRKVNFSKCFSQNLREFTNLLRDSLSYSRNFFIIYVLSLLFTH